eukprot:9476875-Pyramimonas_sp.AAC.2
MRTLGGIVEVRTLGSSKFEPWDRRSSNPGIVEVRPLGSSKFEPWDRRIALSFDWHVGRTRKSRHPQIAYSSIVLATWIALAICWHSLLSIAMACLIRAGVVADVAPGRDLVRRRV